MTRVLILFCLIFFFVQPLLAEDPGASEDAREEKTKLLKAADEVEMIQANSETLRTDVDSLKTEIAKLEEENSELKQEVSDLKASLEKMDAARAKEREVLLGEVSKLISESSKPAVSLPEKKKGEGSSEKNETQAEHGFYHVVEKGETLSMIAAAYREHGDNVTIDDIRQANSLGPKDVIRVGQKLFVPKKTDSESDSTSKSAEEKSN